MIVDMFSTVLDGSPALAARRLHTALREKGVESRFWYTQPSSEIRPDASYRRMAWSTRRPDRWSDVPQWVRHRARWMSLRRAAAQALEGGFDDAGGFTPWFAKHPTPPRRELLSGDLLHLHWMARHLDWASFFAGIPTARPIVWTMHDMTPMTGGCPYADDCRAFHEQCRYCPLLSQPGPEDLSSLAFATKQAAYATRPLHIVTSSRWLEEQVRQSALLRGAASVRTIYTPLNTEIYHPIDKRRARHELGLDPDCFWIGFAADQVAEPRMGLADLLRAMREWPSRTRAHVLLCGHGTAPALDNGISVHHFGHQRNDHRLRLLHAAADVLVAASHLDNLTCASVEAMACATPVVAYAVGGAEEIVRNRETGLLARRGDTAELLQHLLWLADHPAERRRMGTAARELVVREFDQRRQAAKYLATYEEALESTTIPTPASDRRLAA